MTKIRHLSKAPITEAIVDLRVKARDEFDADEFSKLKEALADRLPEIGKQRAVEASVSYSQETGLEPSARDLGTRGYFFKSSDGLNIAQFRIDGFTYNRLAPYTSWDQIFPNAMDLWKLYMETANPSHVSRLALRYLNHIALPAAIKELEDVMTAPPHIPPELPQHMSQFVTRITLHDPEAELAAHVTQAFDPDKGEGKGTLILDIDAFYQKDFDLGRSDTAERIERIFNELRKFKNKIFFGSLTEQEINELE